MVRIQLMEFYNCFVCVAIAMLCEVCQYFRIYARIDTASLYLIAFDVCGRLSSIFWALGTVSLSSIPIWLREKGKFHFRRTEFHSRVRAYVVALVVATNSLGRIM